MNKAAQEFIAGIEAANLFWEEDAELAALRHELKFEGCPISGVELEEMLEEIWFEDENFILLFSDDNNFSVVNRELSRVWQLSGTIGVGDNLGWMR